MFAPWVNRVYFVTWGHIPAWLNTENPKLTVVKHTDFIPSEYLPTFNSNPIELNIHRIPGLSEQFVLFNDDFFLTAPVQPEDFFRNGLPCEVVRLGQLSALSPEDSIFPHMILNNMAIINKHFSKREVLCKHWRKFYSLRYGKDFVRNLLLAPAKHFSCFNDQHIATSYLKKSFQEVWNAEPELLDAACHNRFRTKDDLTHWLVKAWQCCKGDFYPRSICFGQYLEMGDDRIPALLKNQRYRLVCLNDCRENLDFYMVQRSIMSSFESILPHQSSYEQ